MGLVDSPAWKELWDHSAEMQQVSLGDLALNDPARLDSCEIKLGGLCLNYAFNFANVKTIALLAKLAENEKVSDARAKMFAGDKINTSENRAALHTALRQKDTQPVMVDGRDVLQDIKAARQQMAKFAAAVRDGSFKGSTGKSIRTVINIGIGGSDLGPRLAVEALAACAAGPEVRFVANADAFDLLSAIKDCDPEETLFVVVSKTFGTQETLLNANSAKAWLTTKLGEKAASKHFAAVTANAVEANKFGISSDMTFPMWDWVGGRFSLWSAVGLSIALAVGMDNFEKILDGANAMDAHFRTAPFAQNMPVVMAMLSVWHRDFFTRRAQAVLPYSERLRNLPRYLQQLEMESGGKSASRDGGKAECATAPVVFGECGTVGQHSFLQWLHQGSDIVPTDFIGVAEDDLGKPEHHSALLANMVAQAGALAFGQPNAEHAHDVYVGGRPSNLLIMDKLDPFNFGALLALYEHKVFVQGVIWNINVFDQPGVELGKKMARGLEAGAVSKGAKDLLLSGLLGRITGKSR